MNHHDPYNNQGTIDPISHDGARWDRGTSPPIPWNKALFFFGGGSIGVGYP